MISLNDHLSALNRSPIRQFTALAGETPGCVKLTLGEPDFDTPASIRAAAWEALRKNRTHYAPNQGVPALVNAIAAKEGCAPTQVLITLGATGALYTALTGLLNPGEEVVIPTPAFNLYASIVTAAGGVPVVLDMAKTGFQITEEALNGVLTEKTKAIVLNSPNNPTGTVQSRQSLDAVKAAVLGKPIFVICDEVYRALSYGDCPRLWGDPQLSGQLLLCQSFSKPYAMTGWRIGYLAGPEDVMGRLLLLHASMAAAVPTFLQDACVTALETDVSGMQADYRARRDFVCRRLTDMGLSYPEPMGAFYVFPEISRFGMGSEEFCIRMIREGGVATVPGTCFGAPDHIRISYASSMENLEIAMDRMERFLKGL